MTAKRKILTLNIYSKVSQKRVVPLSPSPLCADASVTFVVKTKRKTKHRGAMTYSLEITHTYCLARLCEDRSKESFFKNPKVEQCLCSIVGRKAYVGFLYMDEVVVGRVWTMSELGLGP